MIKYKIYKSGKCSPMESRLCKIFNKENIKYCREVMFDGCVNPITGLSLRYDFYLPEINVLVEYDGKAYHNEEAVMIRDKIKNDFAKSINIRLYRISGKKQIVSFLSDIGVKNVYFKDKISDINLDKAINLLHTDTELFYNYYLNLRCSGGIKSTNKIKKIAPELYEYPKARLLRLHKNEIIYRLSKYIK